MATYLIYFNQQWVGEHSEEWFRSRVAPSMAVVDQMKEAGVYVFAGGLEQDGPVFAADATSGTVTVTEGPFAETTEHLGGFTVVDVADDERARYWAGRLAVALKWPQEVHRFPSPQDPKVTGG